MKKNNKGFTLAELLIVVAIIAVLVAIAIPIFTSQLEKSRDATSVANLRSAYAEAQVAVLNGESSANATWDKDAKTVTVTNVIIKTEQKNDWSGLAADLPWNVGATGGITPADPGSSGKMTAVFEYNDNFIVTKVTLS